MRKMTKHDISITDLRATVAINFDLIVKTGSREIELLDKAIFAQELPKNFDILDLLETEVLIEGDYDAWGFMETIAKFMFGVLETYNDLVQDYEETY